MTSSSAAADANHLNALESDSKQPVRHGAVYQHEPFRWHYAGASDVLVKFTYYGDANLDGKVDAALGFL